jgi:hypothetical protein
MEAAVADAEVEAWRRELEHGRRIDTARSVAVVIGREPDQHALEAIWVLLGPEVYLKLTTDTGYGRAEYEAFLDDVLRRVIRPSKR